jgi:hypothetical protein
MVFCSMITGKEDIGNCSMMYSERRIGKLFNKLSVKENGGKCGYGITRKEDKGR